MRETVMRRQDGTPHSIGVTMHQPPAINTVATDLYTENASGNTGAGTPAGITFCWIAL